MREIEILTAMTSTDLKKMIRDTIIHVRLGPPDDYQFSTTYLPNLGLRYSVMLVWR